MPQNEKQYLLFNSHSTLRTIRMKMIRKELNRSGLYLTFSTLISPEVSQNILPLANEVCCAVGGRPLAGTVMCYVVEYCVHYRTKLLGFQEPQRESSCRLQQRSSPLSVHMEILSSFRKSQLNGKSLQRAE